MRNAEANAKARAKARATANANTKVKATAGASVWMNRGESIWAMTMSITCGCARKSTLRMQCHAALHAMLVVLHNENRVAYGFAAAAE